MTGNILKNCAMEKVSRMLSTELQFGTNISKDLNLRKIDGVDDNLLTR